MLQFEAKQGVELCDGMTRRDFLRVGALSAGAIGLSLTELAQASSRSSDINCILLFLVGGPSHLDTWDLKPGAPDNIRGPFRPIRTKVSGLDICEHFPRMARMADRFAVVRSVHHEEAPIHETGHQLMQTGKLFSGGQEHPHYGAALSYVHGERDKAVPPFVVLPGEISNTGVSVSHGQVPGSLGARHAPFILGADPAQLGDRREMLGAVDAAQRAYESHRGETGGSAISQLFNKKAKSAFDLAAEQESARARYGKHTFGQSCLLARRLVENGVRLVTVNMFESVFDSITWDCHADSGALPTTLEDYRDVLCPMFDSAYTALLDDLHQRGMLDTTLVLAMGEFGRTPQMNPRGGRDHWPGCWSVLFAGGGIRGGQVLGSSDRTGSEPKDRPVTPAEIAATVYRALRIDPATTIPGPDGRPMALVDATPIHELLQG